MDARNVRDPLPVADIPIVAYDYGIKYNILRRLRQRASGSRGAATTPAAEALKYKPAGIFLSNGPGDPAPLEYAIRGPRFDQNGHPDFWDVWGTRLSGWRSG